MLADKEYRKVARLAPKRHDAKLNHARILLRLKEYEKVDEVLNGFKLWSSGSQATALALKAQALLYRDNMDQLPSIFAQASNLSPDNSEVLFVQAMMDAKAGEVETAMHGLDNALKKNPNESRMLQAKAELYFYNTQYKEALIIFKGLSKQQFANPNLMIDLAWVYITLEDYDSALVELDKALNIASNHPVSNYLKAFILLKSKDYKGASNYAEKVVKSYPGHIGNNFVLAVVSFAKKEFEKANYHIGKVTFAQPNNISALKLQASIQLNLGAKDDAMETLSKIEQGKFF